MSRSMKQKQDGQLAKVTESVIGKRAAALAGGEKVAPQKVLQLIRKCGHREGQRELLQIRVAEEIARYFQSNEDENETKGNESKLLEDNRSEVGRPVLLFLLGPNAHHRRNNQRGLEAVHKEHRHPCECEYSKLAQAHETGKHHVGEKVRRTDNSLVGQRPDFPSQKLPKQTIPQSLPERAFLIHLAPETPASKSLPRRHAGTATPAAHRIA